MPQFSQYDEIVRRLSPAQPAAVDAPPGTGTSPLEAKYDTIFQQQAGQQNTAITAGAAAPTTAARRTEAINIAHENQVPVDFVERNWEMFQAQKKAREFPAVEEMRQQTPKLTEFLAQHPETVPAVQPDIHHMGALDFILSAPANEWNRATASQSYANLRLKGMFSSLTLDEQKRMETQKQAMQAGGDLGADSWWRRMYGGFFNVTAQQLPAAHEAAKYGAVGAVAGGLAIATVGPEMAVLGLIGSGFVAAGARFGMMKGILESTFAQETTQAYDEYLDITDEAGNKLDPRIAKWAALAVGAINAPIEAGAQDYVVGKAGEMLGAKLSRAEVRAQVKNLLRNPSVRATILSAAKNYGKVIGAETMQEVAQQTAQILLGEGAKATGMYPLAPGQLERGNVNLFEQPSVQNPDGTSSTVDSIGVNLDGREMLLPTVTQDGRHLVNELRGTVPPEQLDDAVTKAAVAEYRKSGRHLGAFATPEAGTAFAKQIHEDYAKGVYGTPGSPRTSQFKTGPEMLKEAGQTAVSAAEQFSLGLGLFPSVQVAVQVRQAQASKTLLENVGKIADQADLVKKSPKLTQAIIAHATQGGPTETVYAPTDVWTTYWQSQGQDPGEVATALTGNPNAYEQALKSNEDLAIPLAAWAVRAPAEAAQFWANELRFQPRQWNYRESQEFLSAYNDQLMALKEAEAAQGEQPPAAPTAEEQLRERLRTQLEASGQTSDAAHIQASVAAAGLTQLADRAGMDVTNAVGVTASDLSPGATGVPSAAGGGVADSSTTGAPGAALAQDAFTGTKVVDQQGQPRVVYRGRQESATGPLRSGVSYFTDTAEHAAEYSQGDDTGATPNVLPAHVNLQNPASEADVLRVAKSLNVALPDEAHPVAYLDSTPALVDALKAEGFDGAIGQDRRFDDRGPLTSYAVFDSATQVRPVNDQILHQQGQQEQTQTSAFQQWFGDSKVVDANGNPAIAVHYTQADFDTFDKAKSQGGTGYTTDYGRDYVFPRTGFFFFFGEHIPDTPLKSGVRAVPVYLSIQNPLDLRTGITAEEAQKLIAWAHDNFTYEAHPGHWGHRVRAVKGEVTLREAKQRGMTGPEIWSFLNANSSMERGRTWDSLLDALGKDGVIFEANSSGTYVGEEMRGLKDQAQTYTVAVARRAEQVKAAYANRGTFDSTSQNILYQGNKAEGGTGPAKGSVAPTEPIKTKISTDLDATASLEGTMQHAAVTSNKKRRDLKVGLQARFKATLKALGKRTLNINDPDVQQYLVRVAEADTIEALKANANAVGWYNRTVKAALATIGLIHPEIQTDLEHHFAFTYALAVTSNGLKVDQNFKLAMRAYEYWREHGVMPVEIGEGTAATTINETLERFNEEIGKPGGWRAYAHFLLSEHTVKELEKLGWDTSGENKGTRVFGALVLGPKIGNGFFANLNGFFDQLTMDRWWMRTWGRWTGTLIEERPDLVEPKRKAIQAGVNWLNLPENQETRIEFSWALNYDIRKFPTKATKAQLDELSDRIKKRSEKPFFRQVMQKTPIGDKLRRDGNMSWTNRDGQKESPDSGEERNIIRSVAGQALQRLHALGHQFTMSDLQAVLWYAERRLYDLGTALKGAEAAAKAAKDLKEEEREARRIAAGKPPSKKGKKKKAVEAGYDDEDTPDYANAAAKLARERGISDAAITEAQDAARAAADAEAADARAGSVGERPPAGASVSAGSTQPGSAGQVGAGGTLAETPATGPSTAGAAGVGGSTAATGVGPGGGRLAQGPQTDYEKLIADLFGNPEDDGGFTHSVLEGVPRTEGFALELYPEVGEVFDASEATPKRLLEFVTKNYALLQQPGNHFGGWFNRKGDGRVYLGVSQVLATEQEAIDLGIQKEQIAYFNLSTGTSVNIVYPEDHQHGPTWQGARKDNAPSGDTDVRAGAGDVGQADGTTTDTAGGGGGEAGLGTTPTGGKLASGERGFIQWGADRQFNITLLPTADLSTFLHEAGHLFTEVAGDLVDKLNAQLAAGEVLTTRQNQLIADYNTLLKFAGATDRAGLTVAHHEKIARGFEAYLMEGKAPSAEMRSAFARMRSWFLSIYKSLTNLNVELTPEVRAVFDRMLASDEAIAQAEAEIGMQPLFLTASQAGMSEAEFALYRDRITLVHQKALEELDAKLQAEVLREKTRLWKAREEEVRKDVQVEVYAQQVYRALYAIRYGTAPNGMSLVEGVEAQPLKLSKQAIVDKYGKARLKTLPRPYLYTTEAGLDPDDAARMFGYGSGDALLTALAGAPKMNEVIEGITRERMLSEQGESMMDDGTIDEHAESAISNEDRATVIRLELRALFKLKAQSAGAVKLERAERDYERRWFEAEANLRIKIAEGYKDAKTAALRAKKDEEIARLRDEASNLRQKALRGATTINENIASDETLREAARMRIAQMVITDLKPQVFWAAAMRAGHKATDAAARQQFDEAIDAKTQQLLNLHLFRQAQQTLDEVDARVKFAHNLTKGPARARIGKAGEVYLDQVDNVLDTYEFATVSQKVLARRANLAKFLAALQGAGQPVPVDIPLALLEGVKRRNYKTLSVEAFMGVTDGLKMIVHLASLKNKLLKSEDKRNFEVIKQEIVDSIRLHTKSTKLPNEFLPKHARKEAIRNIFAQLSKISQLAQAMDGYVEGGPMWTHVILPFNKAADEEQERFVQAGEQFQAIVNKHYDLHERARFKTLLDIPEIGGSLTKEAVLALALNWGNAISRDRILTDPHRQWSAGQIDAILDRLDQRDWEFVQETWDFVGSFWPEIEAKMKRTEGVAVERVEPLQVITKFGIYKGGYYPLKYDHRLNQKTGEQEAAQVAKGMMQAAYVSSTTRRGHQEVRLQELKRAVQLDLGVVFQHLQQVIHDLTHHEVLMDVNRILRDPDINLAIRETRGEAVLDQFTSAIQDIAQGTLSEGDKRNILDISANFMRQGTQIASLGLNAWTAAQQPLGIFNGMSRVGVKWVAKGMLRALRDAATFENSMTFIRANSLMMRHRADTGTVDIMELRGKLLKPGGWFDKMLRTVSRDHLTRMALLDGFMWHIGMMQRVADVPTWLGAYEKAKAGGEEDERAFRLADQAVLDSQGGGQIKDLAKVQRGAPIARIWLTFYSYGSTVLNATFRAAGKTQWSNPASVIKFLGHLGLLYAMPSLLTIMMARALGKDDPPDDETWAEFFAAVGKSSLASAMNGIPLLREAQGMLAEGNRGYAGPAGARLVQLAYDLNTQVKQGDVDHAAIRAAVSTAGVVFGFPSAQAQRTIDGYAALAEDRTDNPLVLLFGAPKQ